MQIKTFRVAAWGDPAAEEVLNKFLRAKRVLQIEKHFVAAANNSYWCFCVEYLGAAQTVPSQQRSTVDYREVLDPVAFARFARYRTIRKEVAGGAGVPPYAVFTNKELSEMAQLEELTMKLSKVSRIIYLQVIDP